MLRQRVGSRQSADSSFARCSRLPQRKPYSGSSLPPSLSLSFFLLLLFLLQPDTHTHTFTHIYIECLCSVFSVWNVCLLTGRHGEQLCGQTGERDCSEALERAGYTSTFLSLSSAAFTVSRRLVLSTSRALKLFTAASLFFSELALLLARL